MDTDSVIFECGEAIKLNPDAGERYVQFSE